jgi:hypothetical protein
MNIDHIITELARDEFTYCLENGLALWLTVEQAKSIIDQDGRLQPVTDSEGYLYAGMLLDTFDALTRARAENQTTTTQLEHLVTQHLGDDWTPEAAATVTEQILEILNTHKKGNQ